MVQEMVLAMVEVQVECMRGHGYDRVCWVVCDRRASGW